MRFMQGFSLTACIVVLSACTSWSQWPNDSGSAIKRPNWSNQLAKPSAEEASRFLQQASFGPSAEDISGLQKNGREEWLSAQFNTPQTLLLPDMHPLHAKLAKGKFLSQDVYFSAFWKSATTAPDQLRQRVAFALSQIFVVSFDSMLNVRIRGVASYHDMLARNAFGDFRTLLEEVTRHPMMGVYLSHLRNQKEDPSRGRLPDENYAREIMQLFTIGLQELNPDGSLKLVNGEPVETYTNDDITGLAKVLTGFSYNHSERSNQNFNQVSRQPDWEFLPMVSYPQFHSTSSKKFLGVNIPENATPDPDGDLKIALDRLFNHPNVGPFFGRQLIQRLITSNPSPAYVQRVAAAFNDNGAGTRGDMQAVIRAVLLDPEARQVDARSNGKLREPILRLAQLLRAFHAESISGDFAMFNTDNPGFSLGQSPMRAPTVFNFYRPGFVPPGSRIAQQNMVSPEMQIVSESSVAGYANFLQNTLDVGTGKLTDGKRDIQLHYEEAQNLAHDPAALLNHLDLLLTATQLSASSRQRILHALEDLKLPPNNPQRDTALRNRVKLATLLIMVSPEYLVLR